MYSMYCYRHDRLDNNMEKTDVLMGMHTFSDDTSSNIP